MRQPSRPRIQLHQMTLIAVALSAIVTLACFERYSLAAGNVYDDKYISAGFYHTCVVKSDSTVACWGHNGYGQLNVPAGTFFTQVSAGTYSTCGVKTDGTLACWGDNSYGQATPPAGTFTQVSAGGYHACGVKPDGTLACWGYNYYGQATPPVGTFTQVAAGGNHVCGVKTDGSVACWGYNNFGQATPPVGTFTQVAAGGNHTCGVKTNGTLACWGFNNYGQATPPVGTFTQVAKGGYHACGVKTNGSVACWGDNSNGQATPPGGTFTQVSGGYQHTCGVKTDGTLACWGDNTYGQATPDVTPPVISPSVPSGWAQSKTASVTATDGGTGVAHVYCSTADSGYTDAGTGACSKTFSANGTFWYYACDVAGNCATHQSTAVTQIDTSPPNTPTGVTGAATWQNASSTPTFGWTAPSDVGGSGVAHYHAYWGTSASGTSTTDNAGVSYSPGAQASGTSNYFRVAAVDTVGNVGAWTTAVLWQYDNQAPNTPTGVTGAATWQNASSTPTFGWTAPSDVGGSGVNHYRVYWGASASGTSTTDNVGVSYSPGAQASGTSNYFRVAAVDTAGNVGAWTTAVLWQYDNQAPNTPTGVTGGAVWQNASGTPTFGWTAPSDVGGSGVNHYHVYWGASASGTSTTDNGGVSYSPGAQASGTSNYFRVAAVDTAGNEGAWTTAVLWQCDNQAPNTPTGVTGAATWQNASGTPTFGWTAPSDVGGSGVNHYHVYWGASASGTSTTDNGGVSYSPGAQASGTSNYFRVAAVDAAGNEGAWTTAVLWQYDNQAPNTPTGVTGGATWQRSSNTPTFSWTAPSDVGGSGVNHYHVYWGASSTGTSTTDNAGVSYSPGAQASGTSNYFRVAAVDTAGNVGAWTTAVLWQYEIETPTVTADITGDWVTKNVTATAGDTGGSGVASVWCSTTDGAYTNGGASACSLTFTAEGAFWYYAVDNAGNSSAHQSIAVTGFDTTPPVVTTTVPAGWAQSKTVTVTATDDESGVARVQCRKSLTDDWTEGGLSACALTYTGNGEFYYQATNNAGDSTSGSAPVTQIDTTAPSLSPSVPSGWATSKAASVSASDGESGVAHVYCSTADSDYTDAGAGTCSKNFASNGTFWYYATDDLGNATSHQSTAVTQIDTTAPSLSPSVPSGWAMSKTVTVTATDDESGVASLQCRKSPTDDWTDATEGASVLTYTVNGTLYYQSADALGNASNGSTPVSQIDTTAPGLAPSVPSGWAMSKTVTVTATDDESGLASLQCRKSPMDGWTDATEGTCVLTYTANGTFYYRAMDVVGNVSSENVSVTQIDTTAPDLASTVPAGWATSKTVTVTATDDESGVASLQCRKSPTDDWTDATEGTCVLTYTANGTLYYQAADALGNASSGSAPVSQIDTTAPSLFPSVPSGWAQTKTVTVTATDDESGVASLQCRKSPTDDWTEGEAYSPTAIEGACVLSYTANGTLYYQAADALGNASSGSTPVSQIDTTAPSVPSDVVGGVAWQNVSNTPVFTWAASTDPQGAFGSDASGVAGYDIVWSTDPDATLSTAATVDAGYSPGAQPSGTSSYLRVRARDNAGNLSAWTTAVLWQYDADAPVDVEATAVGIVSLAWTNDGDPVFTLSAIDAASGVAGYKVCWDTSDICAPAALQSSSAYSPGPQSIGVYYLRMIARDVAGNEAPVVSAFVYRYDDQPPTNPTQTVEAHGAVSNAWTTVTTPSFTWSGASDAPSGVDGYYLYFGSDPNGTSSDYTTTTTYAPGQLDSGITYLRLRTQDVAGNLAEWITAFTFKSDTTAPDNPTSVIESHGAISGTWQNTVTAPSFTWSGASDAHSGVEGYFVYFGDDPNGTSTVYTTAATYAAEAVADSVYYLRLQTVDPVGNLAEWVTAFVFQADTTAPVNPTAAVESHDAISGVWTTVAAPSFTWSGAGDGVGYNDHSGVAGYNVYFGPDPLGTSSVFTTSVTYSVDPVGSGVYYLCLQTKDIADNWSAWSTFFEFRSDTTAPVNPTSVIESHGAISGTWQNSITAPAFVWSGASDAHSGVEGYNLYFGPDPLGTSTTYTMATAYASEPVTNGTHYLRLQTKDALGNLSEWDTAFVFDVDTSAPNNPAQVEAPSGIISGTWANTNVTAPVFTWSGAGGGPSGASGYFVYFGPDPLGTSDTLTTAMTYPQGTLQGYTPTAPSETGTYYLRVRTVSGAGTRSDWATLFVVKADLTPPVNPASVIETNGIISSTWTTHTTPHFTWSGASDGQSGVEGHNVYFGLDPDGVTATAHVTATAYTPAPMAVSGVYYLRLQTKDAVGNVSAWETRFVYRLDLTAPTNPISAIESHGALSGAWSVRPAPAFEWSGATDNHSGVDGYHVYFGPNPNGTSLVYTTSTSYAPGMLASGIYYLRLRAKDKVGHQADAWSTVFRYDADVFAPLNPSSAVESHGALSGAWSTVSAPIFTWSGARDDHRGVDGVSGVEGYFVYFGPDPNGVSAVYTPSVTYTPAPVGSGMYYLRLQTKDVAGNLADWATVFVFQSDTTAPVNPTGVIEAHGALSGTWSTVISPTFAWSGASDAPSASGVAGYNIYFGSDPLGTSATYTTSSSLDVVSVADGVHYLRAQTQDTVGNLSAWATLFVFQSDATAPVNPTGVIESHGAISGTWTTVISPTFAWSGAIDLHSGVAGYWVYFGTDPNGTAEVYLTSATYTPAPVGSGTYYLRVRAQDAVGYRAAWATLFVFKSDTTLPVNPLSTVELHGAASGAWSTINAPVFAWSGATGGPSGVEGFYVYFGSDPLGASAVFTTATTYAPGTVSDGVYYLRLRTRGAAGNLSEWDTRFVFQCDTTAPANPNSVVETHGATSGNWAALATPTFTWSEAIDAPSASGVAGYYLYFGADPLGTSGTRATAAAYTPDPVAHNGVYYLRVRAQDVAGNLAEWSTLFEFRSDTTAPANPTGATETHGVANGSWQSAVAAPVFSWAGANDADSGVRGYQVYFGIELNGESSTFITTTSYAPTPVTARGVYRLRIQTVDRAGNVSGWATLFEFWYNVPAATPTPTPVPPNYVYVQADSNNVSTTYGMVLERDEIPGGPAYNNIAYLRLEGTQTTTMVTTYREPSPKGPGAAQPTTTPAGVVTNPVAAGSYTPTTLTPTTFFTIFLPLVFRNYRPSILPPTSQADITTERIVVLTDTVQVVIRNAGAVTVTDDFWVDLYINPIMPPTRVNQPWRELSNQGCVWGVTAPAIPLRPGEAVTLTMNDAYYWPEYSTLAPGVWAALLAGAPPPPLATSAMGVQSAHTQARPPNRLPTRR